MTVPAARSNAISQREMEPLDVDVFTAAMGENTVSLQHVRQENSM